MTQRRGQVDVDSTGSADLIVGVLIALVLLLGTYGIVALQPTALPPTPGVAERLVLIGVPRRGQLSPTDRAVLRRYPQAIQLGTVATATAATCSAGHWATLGAGRTADVGSSCSIRIRQGQVQGWANVVAATTVRNADARLGTLGATVAGCVAAVGPEAGLAAARPDGSLAQFETLTAYRDAGARSACPVTLVDAGQQPDDVVEGLITELADRPGTEVIVAGIGPSTTTAGSGLGVLYRVSGPPAGWLTTPSTRQAGVVTLPDLTATLMAFGRPPAAPDSGLTDGSPLRVLPAPVRPPAAARRLQSLDRRSGPLTRAADLAVAVGFAVLAVGALAAGRVARRRDVAAALWSPAVVAPAALSLVGAVPWYRSGHPSVALALTLLGLLAVSLLAGRALTWRWRIPPAVAGAVLTVTALSVDAVTGGLMQRGSLLNPWPMDGGRWYGFGNVTFAVYAAAGLVVVGYLTARQGAPRSRRDGVTAALVAVTMLVCEGWPSFGADFGGLLTLGPPLAWLLATTLRTRHPRILVVALGSVAVAAAVGVAGWDWSRGPGARSYLGNFVQRLLDADAGTLLLRKAAAVLHSVGTPAGGVALVVAAVVWFVVLTRVRATAATQWWHPRLSQVVLAAAALGTLLNDSGVAVFATMTVSYAATVTSLRIDGAGPAPAYERAPRP